MRVSEILLLLPTAAPLLSEHGLSCFSCSANAYETLEEGCRSHGFSDLQIQDLVTDLNELLASQPERPRHLTLTHAAALALEAILRREGKENAVLVVGVDEAGGFCMEIEDVLPEGHVRFSEERVPSVSIAASALTLNRIGGATIDFRDNRFKLDLPEDRQSCACGGSCDCK